MADLLLGIRNAYRGVSSQVLLKYHWGVEHPKTIVTTSIAVAACAAYFFPVTIGSFAFVVFGGKYLIGKVKYGNSIYTCLAKKRRAIQ
ncbi:MAG: hypothetical protein HZB76_00175 [Chlamydiae bacterium]|nr:hypothetical protein [Chlamydiota bacterium]